MKKRWIPSLILSAVCTFIGMGINYVGFVTTTVMPLAYTMYGGELIEDWGFGLIACSIYSMEPGGGTSRSLAFEPISFFVTVALFFLIFRILFLVLDGVKKKKS